MTMSVTAARDGVPRLLSPIRDELRTDEAKVQYLSRRSPVEPPNLPVRLVLSGASARTPRPSDDSSRVCRAVFRLRSPQSTHQLGRINIEKFGQLQNVVQADVSLPSFDLTDERPVQPRLVRQFFLAFAEF
jgi:hypothetical protein